MHRALAYPKCVPSVYKIVTNAQQVSTPDSDADRTQTSLLPALSPQTHRRSLELLKSVVAHQAPQLMPLCDGMISAFCAPACQESSAALTSSQTTVGNIFRSCIKQHGISDCVDVGDMQRMDAALGVEGGEGEDAKGVVSTRDIRADVITLPCVATLPK
jgi:hypothetical protein